MSEAFEKLGLVAACSWASVVSGYSLPLPGSLVQVPAPISTSAASELMQDAQHTQGRQPFFS